MVDEIHGEDFEGMPKRNPATLLDRRFLSVTILENSDEITDLIRPILRKFIGAKAMTTEEHELCQFFEEEAIDADQ
jgi:hypothetical protein